jgi:hypothetical protein
LNQAIICVDAIAPGKALQILGELAQMTIGIPKKPVHHGLVWVGKNAGGFFEG